MTLFLQFITCSCLIFIASHYVSISGKNISTQMKWHQGFVGVLFLALATSMPEITTSLSTVPAVFGIKNINLGFGDAIGSIIINLTIIGFLDFYQGKGRILAQADKKNTLTASFTLGMLTVLGFFMFIRTGAFSGMTLFNVGWESIIVIVLYFCGMKILSRKFQAEMNREGSSFLLGEWLKFIFLLFIIFALGLWLGMIGKKIAAATSINQSFIGAFFLAFSTSLPEIAVSFSALRQGYIDMAIGNILGSNFFDVCIVPLMDVFYRKGPILQYLANINIFVIFIAIIMTAAVIIGLSIRVHDTKKRLGWDAILIASLGLLGYYVIYKFG